MNLFSFFSVLVLSLTAACGKSAPPVKVVGPAPDSFRVAFETTRGAFTVQVNRAWAPKGADRFYALVQNNFFNDERFFRVVPGFMAQFGLNDNPKVNEQWDEPITDDPVVQSNTRGRLTFATEGANTRSHQLFINYKDNSRLDRLGFAPIGEVVDGMAVVDSLYSEYGEQPEQHFIMTMGNSYLNRLFPKLDYIKSTRIVP